MVARQLLLALFIVSAPMALGQDMWLAMSQFKDVINVGSGVTYTVHVTNAGSIPAENVTLSGTTPANTTLIGFQQGTGPAFTITKPPAGGTGAITATIATLPAGATARFDFTIRVVPGTPHLTPITNTMTLTSTTPDPDPTNNGQTLTATANAGPQLLVGSFTNASTAAIAGTNLTYNIGLLNDGLAAAENLTLTITPPAHTTFVSFSDGTGLFTVSTPPAGGTGPITVTRASYGGDSEMHFFMTVRVDPATPAGTVLANVVNVTTTSPEIDTADNSHTRNIAVVTSADLSVTKSAVQDPVAAGSNLVYMLTVANAGPSDAQNVVLTDTIPAGLTFVPMSQTSGPAATLDRDATTATATIPTLPAGSTATFELVVNVPTSAASPLANTAAVSSATTDPNTANSSTTIATNVVPVVDLDVDKTGSPDPVPPGSNLTYTITVTNNGAAAAADATLTDAIPANTTFVSAVQISGPAATLSSPPIGGTGTFTADFVSFPGGATATFALVVRVSPATPPGTTITNTASVSTLSGDVQPFNNSDPDTATVAAVPAAVPTLSETMLLLFATAIAAAAVIAMRRVA